MDDQAKDAGSTPVLVAPRRWPRPRPSVGRNGDHRLGRTASWLGSARRHRGLLRLRLPGTVRTSTMSVFEVALGRSAPKY